MNILFTCAGRRNYLLQYFRDALHNNGRIIAADMQITAPALAVADRAFIVPEMYADGYLDIIIEICLKEHVNALVPLNDLELPILASSKEKFEALGVKLIVSNEKVIDTCFDKYETIKFGKKLKINLPKTFLTLDQAKNAITNGTLEFPLVVKPRWGSASIGLEFPQTMEELKNAFKLVSLRVSRGILFEASKKYLDKAVLIQEMIIGKEFGLDILNDFDGNPVQVYVKEKLAMRAGETDKAVLRDKAELEELGFHIGQALGHIGNLDCDMFESNGIYYLLELNPRFGGGYPFSHMAGANYPAAICRWIEKKPYNFTNFKKEYDQPYAKYDNLIRVLK